MIKDLIHNNAPTLVRIVEFLDGEQEVYHPVLGWYVTPQSIEVITLTPTPAHDRWLYEIVYAAPYALESHGKFRSVDGTFIADNIFACREHFGTLIAAVPVDIPAAVPSSSSSAGGLRRWPGAVGTV